MSSGGTPGSMSVSLSGRELEIIELVAEGLTTQEIAERLTISKRTVDNHVSNVFTKTRYALNLPGGDWVVDCFAGENAPLVLAEVELPSVDTPLERPSWCGLEITGDNRWSNAALASHPLSRWPRDLKDSFDLL